MHPYRELPTDIAWNCVTSASVPSLSVEVDCFAYTMTAYQLFKIKLSFKWKCCVGTADSLSASFIVFQQNVIIAQLNIFRSMILET